MKEFQSDGTKGSSETRNLKSSETRRRLELVEGRN